MGLAVIDMTTGKSVTGTITYTYTGGSAYTTSSSGTSTIYPYQSFNSASGYVVPLNATASSNTNCYYVVKATGSSASTSIKVGCGTTMNKDYWSDKTISGIGYGMTTTTAITSDRTFANYIGLFSYVGQYQQATLPWSGNFKMECWGAQGGTLSGSFANPTGGYGGYTCGTFLQSINTNFYVYVGQCGVAASRTRTFNGGGGGAILQPECASGGGATDIRIVGSSDWSNSASLQTRIMVAGGGAGGERSNVAGAAGGLSSYDSNSLSADIATQTYGYRLGYGEHADNGITASGAGGGYFGGITGGAIGWPNGTSTSYSGYLASAGGSSFISGHNGCKAISSVTIKTRTIYDNFTHAVVTENYDAITTNGTCVYTYNNVSYEFSNTKMIDGKGYSWGSSRGSLEVMPNPSGGYYSSGVGRSGNGYARITSQ